MLRWTLRRVGDWESGYTRLGSLRVCLRRGRIGLALIQGVRRVFDPVHWPDWVQIVRLLSATAATVAFGIHAYNRHVLESDEAVSRRKWMYWLYAMVFLAVTLANFAELWIAVAFSTYGRAPLGLAYLTLLLGLSYVALLGGASRKPFR